MKDLNVILAVITTAIVILAAITMVLVIVAGLLSAVAHQADINAEAARYHLAE